MKTAVVFLHGNNTDVSQATFYCKKADLIICADGGAEHALKLGIVPDMIIGDLDSLPSSTKKTLPKTVKILQYPREKDFTDSELAIEYAIKQHIDKIIVFGYFGDRFDHMMANLFHFSQYDIDISIIEALQQFSFIKNASHFEGKPGDELSLIPLTKICSGISTMGLQYPLTNATLKNGSTRGVSNVFMTNSAQVEIQKGILLAVYRDISTI